ncbi:hypothetical protein DINM_003404 [Dirofilaria immitis]|nr:hypothetical protein [Dirofilaria immitis]
MEGLDKSNKVEKKLKKAEQCKESSRTFDKHYLPHCAICIIALSLHANITLDEAIEIQGSTSGVNMGDLIGFVYAGIIIAGGLIGYFKAGSIISLGVGLAFGSAAGFAVQFNNTLMLLVASSGLTLIMGIRFIQSNKIMPAGIVAVLSFGMVIRCLLRYIQVSESADNASHTV